MKFSFSHCSAIWLGVFTFSSPVLLSSLEVCSLSVFLIGCSASTLVCSSNAFNSASYLVSCHSKFFILSSCFFTISLYTLSENLKVPFALSSFAFSKRFLVFSNSFLTLSFSDSNCCFVFCCSHYFLLRRYLAFKSIFTRRKGH